MLLAALQVRLRIADVLHFSRVRGTTLLLSKLSITFLGYFETIKTDVQGEVANTSAHKTAACINAWTSIEWQYPRSLLVNFDTTNVLGIQKLIYSADLIQRRFAWPGLPESGGGKSCNTDGSLHRGSLHQSLPVHINFGWTPKVECRFRIPF